MQCGQQEGEHMVYFRSLDEAVTYAKKCYLETGYTVWYDNEKKMYYVIGK